MKKLIKKNCSLSSYTSEIDRRQSQNKKNTVSTQMGDAATDRFSHELRKQLNKLMEENHGWMTLPLTQKSEQQITKSSQYTLEGIIVGLF